MCYHLICFMGRKKKKHIEEELDEETRSLGERTRAWILALACFSAALFFILATFGKAGLAGTMLRGVFSEFFGFGYYLFPVIFAIFGATVILRGQEAFRLT